MMGKTLARVAPRMGRSMRHPSHPFQIETRPWQITPFFIAPVLPGETMKNLLMQARCVTDPIKNPLIGWWAEYYFFYVRHRDLSSPDVYQNMMLDPAADMSSVKSAVASTNTYFHADAGNGSINYVFRCMNAVTMAYFRDSAEGATTNPTISGLPLAKLAGPAAGKGDSWMDSMMNDADMPAAYDADVDSADANTTIQTNEVVDALKRWELFRDQGLTDMTYDDYLATFGVKREKETAAELQIPELVRYGREWNYPTAVVNPSTGAPSSAVHWSTTARADKDRFFREPGFLFGVMCFRPKIYYKAQAGSLTQYLDNVYAWLPAVLEDRPEISLKQFLRDRGPIGSAAAPVTDAGGYWVDLKDLFLYGEQFVNFDLTTKTDGNLVAVPTPAMVKEYPVTTDMDALFAAASPANKVRCDGLVSLSIAGRQTDTSGKVSG